MINKYIVNDKCIKHKRRDVLVMKIEPHSLYTPEEVSEILRMSLSWVRKAIASKRLPAIYIGGKSFVRGDMLSHILKNGVK
jgi:excisionase family DNA binding protein